MKVFGLWKFSIPVSNGFARFGGILNTIWLLLENVFASPYTCVFVYDTDFVAVLDQINLTDCMKITECVSWNNII